MMKFRPKQGSNLIISKVGNNWTGVNDPRRSCLRKWASWEAHCHQLTPNVNKLYNSCWSLVVNNQHAWCLAMHRFL